MTQRARRNAARDEGYRYAGLHPNGFPSVVRIFRFRVSQSHGHDVPAIAFLGDSACGTRTGACARSTLVGAPGGCCRTNELLFACFKEWEGLCCHK